MTDRIPLDELTSDALDQLYAELAEAQRQVVAWKTRAGIRATQRRQHERRAERAEAALATFKDRVQAVTDEARGGIRQQLGDALAALDEQQEQPPAVPASARCRCGHARDLHNDTDCAGCAHEGRLLGQHSFVAAD